MVPTIKFLSLISEMAGRCARTTRSPTAAKRAAGLLDATGNRWHCWRLNSESDRQLRFRLQLHLHTLAISIEEDLTMLDDLERSEHCAADKTNSSAPG